MCDEKFQFLKDFKIHLKLSHNFEGKVQPYSCDVCHKKFTFKGSFQKHLQTHLEAKSKTATSSSLSSLVVKKLTKKKRIKFPCEMCLEMFSLTSKLKEHMQTVHNFHGKVKPFACNVCNKKFSFRAALEKHLKNHPTSATQNQPFKIRIQKQIKISCEMCPEVFSLTLKLKEHMQTVHDFHGKVKPFTCEVCNKKFSFRASYQKHIENHSSSANQGQPFNAKKRIKFTCEMCSEIFSLTRKLKEHMKTVHDFHGKVKPFACNICNKKFSFRAAYQKHIENHPAPKTPHTSKASSDDPNISVDQLQLGPFPCTMCDLVFDTPHKLSSHVRKDHEVTGIVKALSCPQCSLKFSGLANLERHVKEVHLHLQPFECDLCPRKFSR
jgi:KRAB domain-containing zinc finger protein